ncbi:cytoplasmic glutamyl-tRNA synthetase [Nosema bombycis CQ1]|uniref:Probable glutamate--tRNA ligase, cytoplasmic n=1 Tax=Nosema bombycis (strain CQ1 / CVCC 102059) TaxID=578461 RepID=R0KPE2_NOSB1|nr:cytoplasmic glutamyl-tRNA synthetase [Nosema bombycis CQ1]|eukprot:EOB12057.1 cytoplasmic glutamyl-tRNA synthetase [Nosema bombycis CQ1]
MSSQNPKEDFVNFFMNSKYGLPKESNPKDHFINQIPVFNDNISFLHSLKNINNESLQKQDLLFCFLNLNPPLLKILKDKKENDKYPELVIWYKEKFEENKKYLKEFNTRKVEDIKVDTNPQIIITRFPPEPSGFLHIGHAKAALVNATLAQKGGRMILRFDDTNPEKKYEEFEDQIIKDLKDLKIEDYTVSHSSDYFSLIIEKAKFLINKGKAYCDDTPQEQMRKERMDGIESKNREMKIEDSLNLFNEMLKGLQPSFCLRAKIDMKDPNKAMRDPVIFRSTNSKHHRVPDLHSFPTYDFTCPILDSIEGVTLACRSNEYRDRNKQYDWFLCNLELKNKPKIFDFSRLNFEKTVLSKRKITQLIENKKVNDWDDPRLSTIQGIKRAGMDMDVLREYILLQGPSQKTSTISWDKIWAMNKKAIDSKSPRFMAVPVKNAVEVYVKNVGYDIKEVENLKSNKSGNNVKVDMKVDNVKDSDNEVMENKVDKGNNVKVHNNSTLSESPTNNLRNTFNSKKSQVFDNLIWISQEDASLLKEGEEFTLMNWGNAIVTEKIVKNHLTLSLTLDLNLKGDYKKTKNKITWVSKVGSIYLRTFEIGDLFKETEEFNEESLKEIYYYAENGISKIKEGEWIPFERIGFFKCDKPFEFNLVPFTQQKRK